MSALVIPIQPLSVTIPMQATDSAVAINVQNITIQGDGSGLVQFYLTNAAGTTIFSGSAPTTATSLATAGCNLSTLAAALQTILLVGLNATHT